MNLLANHFNKMDEMVRPLGSLKSDVRFADFFMFADNDKSVEETLLIDLSIPVAITSLPSKVAEYNLTLLVEKYLLELDGIDTYFTRTRSMDDVWKMTKSILARYKLNDTKILGWSKHVPGHLYLIKEAK